MLEKEFEKCPVCGCDDERYSFFPRDEEYPTPMEINCQRCDFWFVENGRDDVYEYIELHKSGGKQ